MITSALQAVASTAAPFTYLITASGTPAPVFLVTNLPAGLAFDGNHTISGTVAADGFSEIGLSATNSAGVDSETLLLTAATPPTITSDATGTGTVGSKLSFPLAASGTIPVTFAAAGLPSDLVVSGNAIVGIPGSSLTSGRSPPW